MSFNPYAAPEAPIEPSPPSPGGAPGVWRSGRDAVFVSRHADLPPRCVKCNAPVPGPRKLRSFYWHSAGLYLLILLNLLLYALVALIVRKKVEVSPGLCELHAAERMRRIWASAGSMLGGVAVSFFAIEAQQAWIAFAAFFGGLLACIVMAMRARILMPLEISDSGARFRGCGPAFLASLEGRAS